jgi:hypothetical protein
LHQYRELTIKVAKRTLISMHFDSDVVTDASPHARTMTNQGGVTLDTTTKKWGAGSAAFDGTASAYLYVASEDWNLYNADFGASLQWLPDLDPATRYYALFSYGNWSNGWGVYYDQTNDIIAFNILGRWAFNTSALLATYGIDLADGAFHHIEVNRWADDWGIWVDGKQCGYETSEPRTRTAPIAMAAATSTRYGSSETGISTSRACIIPLILRRPPRPMPTTTISSLPRAANATRWLSRSPGQMACSK